MQPRTRYTQSQKKEYAARSYEEGLEEIAAEAGVHRSSVYTWRKWVPHPKAAQILADRETMSATEVAEKHGITRQEVAAFANKRSRPLKAYRRLTAAAKRNGTALPANLPPPSELSDEYLEACIREVTARAHRYLAKAAAFERLARGEDVEPHRNGSAL